METFCAFTWGAIWGEGFALMFNWSVPLIICATAFAVGCLLVPGPSRPSTHSHLSSSYILSFQPDSAWFDSWLRLRFN